MLAKLTAAIKNKHFLSLAGNVMMSAVGVITIGILARVLPIRDLGIWVFFQTSFVTVDTFRTGFLVVAFIKFYSGTDKERADEVTGSMWFLAILISLTLALINIPVYFLLPHISDVSIAFFVKWYGGVFLITIPTFVAACLQQGNQRFDRILYIRIATQGTILLSIITLALTHHISLQTLLYTYYAANTFASIYVLLMGWTDFHTLARRSKKAMKEIYDFGKFSVTSTLSSNLFRTSDVYIINFALGAAGPAAVAIYNLGGSLTQIIEIPLRSFVATAMPTLSQAFNRDNRPEFVLTLKRYVGMLTLMLIPVSIIAVFLADFAISLIGGGKYVHTEAANVFRLFMTFSLLNPAERFFGVSIDAINKPRVNLYRILAMLAANVITDLIGIHITHNLYGVTVATIFPALVGLIYGYKVVKGYYPFSFFSIYQQGIKEIKSFVNNYLSKSKRADEVHA